MQFGNSSTERRNLVDLMDGYFRLYAPVLTRLLQQFPKASGIHPFIGREDPVALLEDENGYSYSSKTLDRKAAKLLTPLVDTTTRLQRSCRITEERDEPVKVSASRIGEQIAVQVMVSDRLGSICTRRVGRCAPEKSAAFFLFPPEINVTAGSEDPAAMERLRAAVGNGFAAAVREASDAKIILNYPARGYDENIDLWLEDFPRAEGDPALLRPFVEHFHLIAAQATHKPLLIMAPASCFEEFSSRHSKDVVVERLEFESGSFTPVP